MELGEYIKAHKPPDGFPKASGACEDSVEVGRGAKTLIRAINVWTEEHDVLDSLVWVSTSAVRGYIWDSLSGKERVESYLFSTELRG